MARLFQANLIIVVPFRKQYLADNVSVGIKNPLKHIHIPLKNIHIRVLKKTIVVILMANLKQSAIQPMKTNVGNTAMLPNVIVTHHPLRPFATIIQIFKVDLGPKECTASKVYHIMKDVCNEQMDASENKNCYGGVYREIMALAKTSSYDDAYVTLSTFCEDLVQQASNEADTKGWEMLENEGSINLEEFFNGEGFLNDETGNIQQEENNSLKRGGKNKFIYILEMILD
jgi:hypothetical protein